jgi:hypothetical protein
MTIAIKKPNQKIHTIPLVVYNQDVCHIFSSLNI